ncbi:MAG: serine/threonine-protein kinase, partial [Myxococcota bacterium]
MVPSIRQIKEGTILDQRFQIQGVLGKGGFATVYKARQLNIDRPVALKILGIRPGKDDEELELFTRRFFLEARSAANINHPGVVTIFDHGVTEGGVPYISMELLDGHTLDTELAHSGPMDPTRALPLFIRCLDALKAAHVMNIVHKDLKPPNLFLTKPGSVVESLKILDFGIAAMANADQDERLTSTDQYIGTAAYCAPEYYQKGLVTPALDVYQMGLVLAETLMGHKVVSASDPMRALI